ncbi:MAG: hypothetical protein ACKO6Q_05250 [Bacteroidota bacterium]
MKRFVNLTIIVFSLIICCSFETAPIRNSVLISSEVSGQTVLESDIKYCIAKAIGIDNKVKHDQRYTPNRSLVIPQEDQSNRYRTLLKRVASKTYQFNLSRLPASIAIKFEKELFEDDDNDFLKNMNEVEWEIQINPNRKYTVKMYYFIYGDFDPNGQIETTFDMNNKTYSSTLSVGRVDPDSDDNIETTIKISNDVVKAYSKKRSQ